VDGFALGTINRLNSEARRANSVIDQANENIEILNRRVVEKNGRIALLESRIAELELALLIKQAHAEGLTAMVKAYSSSHPNSPMKADTGKRFKSGAIKTAGQLEYATAFDVFLSTKGIANPQIHRAD